ncbi:hypothetical protein E5676_scaffold615G00370 [Cucumis melo var. makuwa]|uniref:Uncharacterized protein n=1 Tax=Cucumis melo var. makuwa TaxID=1194695 RepID=A0A5D3CAI3_CUCMM|nr:hypothetical protein E6C27_scaffold179G00120 [Cucumis melo var. makuwa]TYK09007.1 hypothetical protein E5676_scaffold615G00370 [Cucumis melo var. makuwa]
MADINKKNIQEQQQQLQQDVNLQNDTSISQQQIEIVPTNEELDRSPKQPRITESNEAESSKQNEQESDSDSDTDPLLLTEEILLKYKDFIEYVYQFLKNDGEKQDWSEIVERAKRLVGSTHLNMAIVIVGMECLEDMGSSSEKKYKFRETHIPNILSLLRYINTRIASSSSFRLVSDIKNRGKVLPICLEEFERWRQDLNLLIDEMQALKKMALELDREDEEKTD